MVVAQQIEQSMTGYGFVLLLGNETKARGPSMMRMAFRASPAFPPPGLQEEVVSENANGSFLPPWCSCS
jgi:hypothetical protein